MRARAPSAFEKVLRLMSAVGTKRTTLPATSGLGARRVHGCASQWQMLGRRRLSVCWAGLLFMTKSSYSEGLP